LLGWNPRYAKPEEFKFAREQWFVPYTGLCDVGSSPANDRPTQVLEMIPEDGCRPADLLDRACDHFDVSPRTIFRDLKELKERGLIYTDDAGNIQRRKLN
jgi:DNA-binding transcriptional ArsR family regulator